MSGRPLALVGEVDSRDSLVESLTADNRRLARELSEVKAELQRVMHENSSSVSELRKVLLPLYVGLQRVFGEMEVIAGAEYETASSSRVSAVWESWKQKLPGMPSRMIDALLVHGDMTAAQLRVAMQCRLNGVYETAVKLNKLGLLNKSGGRYSLKQL